jgi:arylsulfatase A
MLTSRRRFLHAIGAGAAGLAFGSLNCKKKSSKPNIVLIMADDMGYETLTCNGGQSYRTPVLDELARKGMRFEHCYATPLCTPSRHELLTGKYCFRDYGGWTNLNFNNITFGHVLQDAGYATCIVQKWQLGREIEGPELAGFDEFFINKKGKPEVNPDFYWNPKVIDNGNVISVQDEYGPKAFCDYLLDFIDRHQNEPFFAYFPMKLPHDPFVPTPDSPDRGWEPVEGIHFPVNRGDPRYFQDMVAYVDKMVGRIINKLDQLGCAENTLVLFTADNGTHPLIQSQFKNRVVTGGKGEMTDAGTRVPLIAYWTGTTPEGQVNKDLIDYTDFLPTLAEVAGANLPDVFLDGKSFYPQLLGEKGTPRDWAACYYPLGGWNRSNPSMFVRTQRYKLYDDGRFYDVQTDPEEKNPIQNPESDEKIIKNMLSKTMERLRAQVDD